MRRVSKGNKRGTRYQAVSARLIPTKVLTGSKVKKESKEATKQPFSPERDNLDINKTLLTDVMKIVIPEANLKRVDINRGVCDTPKMKFRYTDIKDLLYTLRDEGIFNCSNNIVRTIIARYNRILKNK